MTRYKSTKHRVTTSASVVKTKRITHSKIPILRAKFAKKQKGKCPICERKLSRLINVLDHCHTTGYLRGTLCNNCNGLEGKLSGLLNRLDVGKIGFDRLLENLANHRSADNLRTKWIHPAAETLVESKARKAKRARKLYLEKKRKR